MFALSVYEIYVVEQEMFQKYLCSVEEFQLLEILEKFVKFQIMNNVIRLKVENTASNTHYLGLELQNKFLCILISQNIYVLFGSIWPYFMGELFKIDALPVISSFWEGRVDRETLVLSFLINLTGIC